MEQEGRMGQRRWNRKRTSKEFGGKYSKAGSGWEKG